MFLLLTLPVRGGGLFYLEIYISSQENVLCWCLLVILVIKH